MDTKMDLFKKCTPSDHLINTEEELLSTIHNKYKKNYYFTYIGMNCVVAINPFMGLPKLYSNQMIQTYQNNNFMTLPAHIFGCFEYAYFYMKNFGNASIVLFGETGSGKSAVRKHCLRYLVSERNGGDLRRVADQIINANLLIDAFGSAKIETNESVHYSTRHVIFFDLEFDFKGAIAGGNINDICGLEKSRVVNLKNNERNYHIFYQLIAGADIKLLKLLKLQRKTSNFNLLNCGGKNIHYDAYNNDCKQFAITKDCFLTLGFEESDILFIWKVLSSILKIGNLEFIPKVNITGSDSCNLSNEHELYETCELLLIDVYDFQNALTRRVIETKKNERIISDLTAIEAAFVRDIICKTLYTRLFSWIVRKINDVIRPKKVIKVRKCIGVLDTFGFEHYKTNNFDLFIKNYCNERLLKHFVDINIRHEQEIYEQQEIGWSKIDINTYDICSEIEKNIFTSLNEDCLYLNLTEQQLLHQFTCDGKSKLITCATCYEPFKNSTLQLNNLTSKCLFKVDSLDSKTLEQHCTFTIKHYFRSIHYDISDFQLKNCEQKLTKTFSTIFYQSNLIALKEMFPEGSLVNLRINTINNKRTISQCAAISFNFENQLNLATKHRKEFTVHCFLPNSDFLLQDNKLKRMDSAESSSSGGCDKQLTTINFNLVYFTNQFLNRQLFNYWRLMKNGYAHRFLFQDFFKRYNLILRSDSMTYHKNLLEMFCSKCQEMSSNHLCSDFKMHSDDTGLINAICKLLVKMDIQPVDINFGSDYLFIKHYYTLFKMEQIRTNRITYLVILIQRTWRCSLLRRRFLLYRQSQFIIARSYLNYRRKKFLLDLADFVSNVSSLSPTYNIWPESTFLPELNEYLYYLYHKLRCKLYRNTFDPIECGKMREKVTASILFKDRKLSYEKSVSHPFQGDYLKLKNNIKWKKLSENEDFCDYYIVFADLVNKVSTSGKYYQCVLALSTRSILILDHRTLHIKQRIPIENIENVSISPYSDDFLIIQMPFSKSKFFLMFEIEHLIEFLTKLFLVIQNLTSKCLEIIVNEDLLIYLTSVKVDF